VPRFVQRAGSPLKKKPKRSKTLDLALFSQTGDPPTMLNYFGDHDAMGTDYRPPSPQPNICPECGQTLATYATSCWRCGHGLPPELQGVPA